MGFWWCPARGMTSLLSPNALKVLCAPRSSRSAFPCGWGAEVAWPLCCAGRGAGDSWGTEAAPKCCCGGWHELCVSRGVQIPQPAPPNQNALPLLTSDTRPGGERENVRAPARAASAPGMVAPDPLCPGHSPGQAVHAAFHSKAQF